MSDVVNLRQARKIKALRAKETAAAEARAVHGRSKADKIASKAEKARSIRELDGHKREDDRDD